MDFVDQQEMGLEFGKDYHFWVRTTNLREKLVWACSATEPGARIAAWIAVVSGIIGIVGLIGLYSVTKDIYHDIRGLWPASASEKSHG